MKKLYILVVAAIVLGGCSVASTIQKASISKSHFDDVAFEGENNIVNNKISDKNAYRIFHQASTGFTSIQSIRVSAEKRASDFCKRQGKGMQTLSERTSTPPHILGNFPRVEIIFSCKAVSNSPMIAKDTGKYEQLRKLKTLLDDGALNIKEYNTEKAKILSQ